MQLCKPQMLHQCVSEGDRRFEKKNIFDIFHLMLARLRSSNAVPGRSNRQFLRWKHSAWETLSQMSIQRTYVHYASLQTQRGGLSSLFCIFSSRGIPKAQARTLGSAVQRVGWGRGMRLLTSKTRRAPRAGAGGGELKGIPKVSRTLAKRRKKKKRERENQQPRRESLLQEPQLRS